MKIGRLRAGPAAGPGGARRRPAPLPAAARLGVRVRPRNRVRQRPLVRSRRAKRPRVCPVELLRPPAPRSGPTGRLPRTGNLLLGTGHGDPTVALSVAAYQTRADSAGVRNLKGPVSFLESMRATCPAHGSQHRPLLALSRVKRPVIPLSTSSVGCYVVVAAILSAFCVVCLDSIPRPSILRGNELS